MPLSGPQVSAYLSTLPSFRAQMTFRTPFPRRGTMPPSPVLQLFSRQMLGQEPTTPDVSPPDPEPPPRLDGYEIIEELPDWALTGRKASQATLYLVRSTRTRVKYVAKLFNRPADSGIAQQTVFILSELVNRHPHCFATIHAYGSLQSTRGLLPFIIMDRVHGKTLDVFLRDLLSRDNPPTDVAFERALRIIERIAHSVMHIDDHQAVHIDLKPTNIIVSADTFARPGDNNETPLRPVDIPVIIDFDVLRTAATPTASRFAGTRQWSAPEQWPPTGTWTPPEPRIPTFRTHVYLLGRLLYFVLSGGRLPYLEPAPIASSDSPAIDDPSHMFAPPIPLTDRSRPAFPLSSGFHPPRLPVSQAAWNCISRSLSFVPDQRGGVADFAASLSDIISDGLKQPASLEVITALKKLCRSSPYGSGSLGQLNEWELRAKVESNGDIRSLTDPLNNGRGILHWAIEVGASPPHEGVERHEDRRSLCSHLVQYLVATCQELISMPDQFGWTPLHLASNLGLSRVVEVLLQRGAYPQVKTPRGATPLYEAAFCPHEDEAHKIIQMLVKAIGDIDTATNICTDDNFTPLMIAIWRRNHNTTRFLGEDLNADKGRRNGKSTALYVLAVRAYCDAVQTAENATFGWIRSEFPDLTMPRELRETPTGVWHVSVDLMRGNESAALDQIRRLKGKEPLNAHFGPYRRTLLHQAAECGSLEVLKSLVDIRPPLSVLARNNHGRTPRDLIPKERADLYMHFLKQEARELSLARKTPERSRTRSKSHRSAK